MDVELESDRMFLIKDVLPPQTFINSGVDLLAGKQRLGLKERPHVAFGLQEGRDEPKIEASAASGNVG